MTTGSGFRLESGHGPGAAPIAAGWYLLRLRMHDPAARLEAPVLYVDYGLGFIEGTRSSLKALVQGGALAGVVLLYHDARGIRVDLGVPSAEVDPRSLALQRIGKFDAAGIMLRARLRRRGGRVRAMWKVLLGALGGGPRGFGDALYGEYISLPQPLASDYLRWSRLYGSLSAEDVQRLRASVPRLARQPRISLLLPVYNPKPEWLRRCLDSVLAQAYPHWELCVADDASTDPRIGDMLRRYAAADARVKVVFRSENGHISAASNSALEAATGEWLALLDHDDELGPHALYMVARAVNEHPQARLIYSDEDKIDGDGMRFDPYFKPDWNPDLFLGHNMISHLGAYEARLVREAGGFRRGFEGSQDYDLALRCIERLVPEQIVHIPHVLYHWRAIPGSTALSKGEKSYASEAGRRAVEDHLRRIGEDEVTVEANEAGYRLRWPLPARPPKVSLVVPTRDRVDLLRVCVGSILDKTEYPNFEIVIVDNQSAEPATLAYFRSLEGHPKVRVLRYDAPFNYSLINNHAVAATDGEIVGLVNNDIEVIDGDWLREMASHAARPEIGCVGAMLYYPDDTIQHAGVILGLGGVANHVCLGMPRGCVGQMGRAQLVQNLSAVTAACLLVRREVFDAVGGLDPRLQVAFNDIDFCLRVREKGYRNLWTPYAELYHHESASRGTEDTPEKRQRFVGEVEFMVRRWGAALENDPAYNPGLALVGNAFDFAVPPRQPLRRALDLGEA